MGVYTDSLRSSVVKYPQGVIDGLGRIAADVDTEAYALAAQTCRTRKQFDERVPALAPIANPVQQHHGRQLPAHSNAIASLDHQPRV